MHQTGETLTINCDAEPGGGAEPLTMTVPIVTVARWFDDRQTCRKAHDWRADNPDGGDLELERLADLTHYLCQSYNPQTAQCAAVPDAPCVFEEPVDAPIWNAIRSWERRPDGGLQPRPIE